MQGGKSFGRVQLYLYFVPLSIMRLYGRLIRQNVFIAQRHSDLIRHIRQIIRVGDGKALPAGNGCDIGEKLRPVLLLWSAGKRVK